MPTYLLKWDATRWDWRNLTEQAEAVKSGLPVSRTWTCGAARRIAPGDRVFIIRLAREPRGIIAAGRVTRGSYEAPGLEQQDGARQKGTMYVDLRFDGLFEPRREACIPRAALSQGGLAAFMWDIATSGVLLPDKVADELETLWGQRSTGTATAQTTVSADVEDARAREATEAERVANEEVAAANAAAERAVAAERAAAEQAVAARAAADKATAAKAAADKAVADRAAAAKAAAEKAAAEKLAAEKAAAEKLAAEKARAEQAAADKLAAEQAAAAKAAADRAAAAKAAADKVAAEQAAKEKAVAERAALEKVAAYKEAADRAAAERAADAERNARDQAALEQRRARDAAAVPPPPSASAPRPVMYPAIVADHFAMLAAELKGALYSKADHRARLAQELGVDDPDSIDVAHQQVSGVLLEVGLPVIDGFRPLGSCPVALRGAVQSWIETHPTEVEALWLGGDASKVAVPVELDDSRSFHVPTPPRADLDAEQAPNWMPKDAVDLDFRVRESEDQRLAVAGQRFVLAFERARLREAGRKDLVGRVEWVAQDRGDALGFQVRSFDDKGEPRLIIVKTTNFGARFPFTLATHELAVARERGAQCCLYRVFAFSRGARLWIMDGPLEPKLGLSPSQFRAVL